jgi:hypothetical protein
MGRSPSRGLSHFRRSLLKYCSKGFSSSILLPSTPPGFAALSSQAVSVPAFPPRRSAKLRRSCQTITMPPEFQNTKREMLNPDLISKSDVLDRSLPAQAKTNILRLFLTRHLSSTLTWREPSGPQKVVSDEYRTKFPFLLFLSRPYDDNHPTHLEFWLYTDVTISESPELMSLSPLPLTSLAVIRRMCSNCTLSLFCCPGV